MDEMSIELGMSLKRAEEITGVLSPSAYEIRQCFNNMSPAEQVMVYNNVKNELKEALESKKKYYQWRKESFSDMKSIYTDMIKSNKTVIDGKAGILLRLSQVNPLLK
jgi:diaminopimelate decarboxylase